MHYFRSTVFVAAVTLMACSSSPHWPVSSCHAPDGDCGLEIVKARVLSAFPELNVIKVLECASEPSRFCYSTEPDEEACLVEVEPDVLRSFESIPSSSQAPLIAIRLMRTFQESVQLVLAQKPEDSLRQKFIYADPGRAQAVLLMTEQRCFNVEEVT